MKKQTLSRRNFLRTTGLATAAVMVVPRRVVGGSGTPAPSQSVNLAAIGVGGMGGADLEALAPGNNVVALCDVDQERAAGSFKKFPQARQYRDFRRMFDEMHKEIDAVLVATPDHCHAVAAMAAIRHDKHVYCEKPLAHSVYEVRELMKAAQAHKVVTQLGNQGHSYDSIRSFCEWIWDGAIGQVHTIHAGCNAVNSGIDELEQAKRGSEVPATLDWEQWLGPASSRPYSPASLPARWRGWTDFGNGTVGDWACHVVDPVYWALDLGAPRTVMAQAPGYDPKTQGKAFPKGDIITYEFPAKGKRGPVTLHWYSGTRRIPRPPELEPDEKGVDTGAVVVGDKGTIVYGSHGARQVRLIPDSKNAAYKRPAQTLPRVREHHWDWLQAIKQGRKAGSDFSYGGPLTEIALLGVVALKFPGTKLEWNAKKMRFHNNSEADSCLNPPYRAGWKL